MAIVISNGLDYITSVFNQKTITFHVPTATAGVKVIISSVDFKPVKSQTDVTYGGLTHRDVYKLDLTNILKHIIGIPALTLATTGLSLSTTITVSATGESSENITTILVYGYDYIGQMPPLIDIFLKGIRTGSTIYHNDGFVSFFFLMPDDDYVLSIGGVDYTYTLVFGYNLIELHSTQKINGTLTDGGNLNILLKYVDKDISNEKAIRWLNDIGCFSGWYFKEISRTNVIESSNAIPVYEESHSSILTRTRLISKAKKINIQLNTIAYNLEHFTQLTRIAESLLIFYDGKVCTVVDYTKDVSTCKQNMRFNITLQYEDYVATY